MLPCICNYGYDRTAQKTFLIPRCSEILAGVRGERHKGETTRFGQSQNYTCQAPVIHQSACEEKLAASTKNGRQCFWSMLVLWPVDDDTTLYEFDITPRWTAKWLHRCSVVQQQRLDRQTVRGISGNSTISCPHAKRKQYNTAHVQRQGAYLLFQVESYLCLSPLGLFNSEPGWPESARCCGWSQSHPCRSGVAGKHSGCQQLLRWAWDRFASKTVGWVHLAPTWHGQDPCLQMRKSTLQDVFGLRQRITGVFGHPQWSTIAQIRAACARLPTEAHTMAGLCYPLLRWSVGRNGATFKPWDPDDGAQQRVDANFDEHVAMQRDAFSQPGRHDEAKYHGKLRTKFNRLVARLLLLFKASFWWWIWRVLFQLSHYSAQCQCSTFFLGWEGPASLVRCLMSASGPWCKSCWV